ncbi:DUF5781 family protein [Halococcus sp. IIIV-5B]|uniref:DUF5781 family protein n=1 Tax=Halococcus sp. IIIV-5B TaxID=2321230 RepID=UPI000E756C0D|nr:DUF5781 family protein [Halococcus sp. IIIV-5B]RJT04131.1 hypothetical protein D3261_10200 [Halococcus sp. IIIV-5B]
MDVRVQSPGPTEPFLGACDLFETEHDLDLPVEVTIREDPDSRTWTAHYDDRHVLNISRQAASSAMARPLALHEYSHMRRYEQSHPSHIQSTGEAITLALAGHTVERRTLTQCYQIANHMKDIYADDITLSVAPADRLVAFLESSLASALADRPVDPPTWKRLTPAADPNITAVNAAFALALLERHDCIPDDHRLYDLAHAAADDAAGVDLPAFKRRFRTLADDPDASEYRRTLVEATREYAIRTGYAAD